MSTEIDQAAITAEILLGLRSVQRFAAEGAVGRGRYAVPPTLPFVALSPPSFRSSERGAGALGHYLRQVVYDVQAWVQVDQINDADHECDLVEVVADELIRTLEDRRGVTSSVLYRLPAFEVSAVALIGGIDPLPSGTVCAFLTVELEYSRRRGLMGVSS